MRRSCGYELNVVPHLHKHLLDVGQAKLAAVMLLQRMKLHCGDPISLDGVVTAGKEGFHSRTKARATAGGSSRDFRGIRSPLSMVATVALDKVFQVWRHFKADAPALLCNLVSKFRGHIAGPAASGVEGDHL